MAGIIEGGIVPANKVADDGDYDKYEIEDAVKTLARAEEIKADAKLMKALRPELEKKAKAYYSLSELRDLAKSKMQQEAEEKATDAENGVGNYDGSDGDYTKGRK